MLRLFLTVLLTILLFPSFGRGMTSQDLTVKLLPNQHLLEGSAILHGEPAPPGQETVYFLAPEADILTVKAGQKPLPYRFENGRLLINATSSSSLTVDYRIRFDNPLPEKMVSIEDPSFGIDATITEQGTYLSESSGWHPRPVGGKSTYRITITGPSGLLGVTSGKLLSLTTDGSETKTIWQVAVPEKALALAAGPYHMERATVGEVELLTFMRDENEELARPYLDACRKYIQLYQELFGPYPYPSFSVVENFYPTGYGLPGWTLLGSSVIKLPFIRHTSLPHEIAHAWWGNAIGIDYASGNWGEGLATYVADYYLKELASATEALEYRLKILRDYSTLAADNSDFPLVDFRSRMSKRDQAIGYGKSAMIYHMLRHKIGDSAFWTGLRLVAKNGRGQIYDWGDLQKQFEEASGIDLNLFFSQWLTRSGAPTIKLAKMTSDKTTTG